MAEKFSHAICKHIIHEICRFTGFDAVKNSSSDVLADVLRSFVVSIGEASVQYCQNSGRTEPNYYDVSKSLKHKMNMEMKELYQFYKALLAENRSVASSSTKNELDFSVFDFDIPQFPKPLPSNLIITAQNEREHNMQTLLQYSLNEKQNDIAAAIPQKESNSDSARTEEEQSELNQIEKLLSENPFLPPLPARHTFSFTSVYNKKLEDSLTMQQLRTKQRRLIEKSLTKIHEADLVLKKGNEVDLVAADRETSSREQTNALYNMVVDLAELQPSPIEERESDKKGKETQVVNPYLVVAKQKNAQIFADEEHIRPAREMTIFDAATEEWGASENQYEQLAKKREEEKATIEELETSKSNKRNKKNKEDENIPSFSLKRPFIATDKDDIEDLLPQNKKKKTTASSGARNKPQAEDTAK